MQSFLDVLSITQNENSVLDFEKNNENKSCPNPRWNPSAFCGQWETNPMPYICTPDAVRLFLLASYCERCLGRTHSARGVRLGILSVPTAIGARQAANPTFTAAVPFCFNWSLHVSKRPLPFAGRCMEVSIAIQPLESGETRKNP